MHTPSPNSKSSAFAWLQTPAFKWLALIVLWTLPELPWVFFLAPSGSPFDSGNFRVGGEWHTIVFSTLRWYFWIPMSVWVARWGRRFPLLADGSPQIRHFGVHLALSAATVLLFHVYDFLLTLVFHGNSFLAQLIVDPSFLRRIVMDWRPATVYWFVLLATFGWQVYQESQQRKLQLTQAHLMALKSQVHPHFLFNTLHSVSTLMADDVDAARKVIARLSDFLRVTLEEPPGDEVPLEDELNLVRLYLEIEHVRFADRMEVEFDIEPASRQVAVPHLLLQPLVENAVVHGLGGRSDASLVRVTSRLKGASLLVDIEDDGPGPGGAPDRQHGGIGLRNTRARVEQLYGKRGSIELVSRPEGGSRCTVRLPVKHLANSL